jgi:hypothetical protein
LGVVFGALKAPVAPPQKWFGLDMTWIGWDNSEWSLTSSADGSVMLPGVRGMTMPPVIHHRAAHASLPGARWRGYSVDVREVFWPLQIYSSIESQDWIEKDRAFWKTLDPSRTGTWIVSQPDGTQRRLKLRFAGDGEAAFDHDPSLTGWNNYGITFAAEQPFWEGDPVTSSYRTGNDAPFFGSTGGPTFTITSDKTTLKAKLNNPGDVDAWPIWRIFGPVTSATVGVGGRTITLPFTVADGRVVEINTDPGFQTAMEGPMDSTGADLTNDWTWKLGAIDFAPLKSRQNSSLTLTIEGTGWIDCTINPRYFRAW